MTQNLLTEIQDFDQLIVYLRDQLDWPIDTDDIEDITYDYTPEELEIKPEDAAAIESIKQLMPLEDEQPWGIFFVEFEKKTLSVVALRRILGKLILKKRAGAQSAERMAWQSSDLLFISKNGIDNERGITFAHFSESAQSQLPVLKVLEWDEKDTLLHIEDVEKTLRNSLKWPQDTQNIDQWRVKWGSAFTLRPKQVIKTSKALAQTLAHLAQQIKQRAIAVLNLENADGSFRKMMQQFQEALIHDMNEESFADMYAQTISYGLLYTAIRDHTEQGSGEISKQRMQQLILPTNRFLQEIMDSFFNLGGSLSGIDFDELGVSEIIDTLKDEKTDFDAILRDFGNKNPNEDPVIHFYELFLGEYDSLVRKSRGVYYTPQPVVSFIVRSVHEALKREFGLELGIADTSNWAEVIKKNKSIKLPKGVKENDFFVQILDPATGTGTFLVETVDVIFKQMQAYWQNQGKDEQQIKSLWNRYVPDCLLPRLYGFEIMMAPYSIAHLKIAIKLYETGYRNFEQDKERVRVYLTNTLEEPVDTTKFLHLCDPAMATESKEANKIKELNSITVVIGNPPYSGHSLNNCDWIRGLLRNKLADGADSYFNVDGQGLGERNPKWLNDDYVKFIRYAQYKLACSGVGAFGFITNHGYLDNPTFRGMRQSLMKTYSDINIIDLHGNAKKKEIAIDGSKDENVFNIMQGVAVNISVKLKDKCNVNHFDIYGTRDQKFNLCKQNTCFGFETTNKLLPTSELYLFCPQNIDVREEYNSYKTISSVLVENCVGIVTARDGLTIGTTKKKIRDTVKDFSALGIEVARAKYDLGTDTRDWKVELAQNDIKKSGASEDKIVQVNYRPFDIKWTYYTGKSKGFLCMPRPEVMRHMLAGENWGLVSSRQTGKADELPIFISNYIIDSHSITSATSISYLFPLYIYPPKGQLMPINTTKWKRGAGGRLPNLDEGFVENLADSLGLEFTSDGRGDLVNNFGPEDIFYYIYAVFHSPEYRSRYAEFLKMDFPRVPVISDLELFKDLVNLGVRLSSLHLLEAADLDEHIINFCGTGDSSVKKVGERGKQLADIKDGKGRLYINNTQYFDGVPANVWEFHIGGYQVCHKWLADRKKAKMQLSAEDITHYRRIVKSIDETIKAMDKIDEAITAAGGFPIS